MPSLIDVPELVDAGFSGLWVKTHEPEEVEEWFDRTARQRNWKLYAWDCVRGIRPLGADRGSPSVQAETPLAALGRTPWSQREEQQPVVLLLHNLHRSIDAPPVAQAMQNEILEARRQRRVLVAVGPVVKLPPEIEKLVTVVDHPLPTFEELSRIAGELTGPENVPSAEPDTVRAAAGLTRLAAENAFTLSLVRHRKVQDRVVWDVKAQELHKSNALGLYRGSEKFSDLGGLESLKQFCTRALGPNRTERGKGILLLGVPGTGKSAFAKALGNETNRPTLTFDMSALMSKFVGESEQNLKAALDVADAMAPCVLFVDEIEKAVSGGAQSQSGDSGVSRRLFGTLVTWLNDHTSDVFFVGTCNDVRGLPPEFARAERFDATFFIDVPNGFEREAIWEQYLGAFGLPGASLLPQCSDWTGAEIKACCRLAKLLDLPLAEAAEFVVPVATSAAEQLASLRSWASGKCLSASSRGKYRGQETRSEPVKRRATSLAKA